ncbi:CPSF A subunit region-domain-containing protein [Diplogelasinospora grovesii]|uniref:CPSF A subunit region-domain-containing protein n=1 Tax=Diplogelasinospora grovesii TaxID=303347 RepID=A0AAN6MXB4_9PEZI|nr:CPSF A subunit region-domain-containing protein [Diplogelasinospora grovesii]
MSIHTFFYRLFASIVFDVILSLRILFLPPRRSAGQVPRKTEPATPHKALRILTVTTQLPPARPFRHVVYKAESNKLIPFAHDTINRWTTCTAIVDYESVAGGDKFGNLWILRCPGRVSQETDDQQRCPRHRDTSYKTTGQFAKQTSTAAASIRVRNLLNNDGKTRVRGDGYRRGDC